MKTYTNPFHTLEDVIATLESLGTNPLCSETNWTSEIISIGVDKKYTDDCKPYYVTQIHVNDNGLREFIKQSPCEFVVTREQHYTDSPYDRIEVVLSDTFVMCALVLREEEFVCQ